MDYYSKGCELVLAPVSPVGVSLDDVRTRLEPIFRQFRYSVNFIHLSELAREAAGITHQPGQDETARLDAAMECGNALRERYGRGDFLALLAIHEINKKRAYTDEAPEPLLRTVHIIRSLKHADEVETLRQTCGAGFFLLGVSASMASRRHHLEQVKGVREDVDRLVERDDMEKDPLGQQTRNVFELADAYVTTDDISRLSDQLTRVIEILFSNPVASPTAEEYAMFMAYAASLRSADLSRLVVNQRGDIVSTGANDVPRPGGGLYWPGEGDQRDHVHNMIAMSAIKGKLPWMSWNAFLGLTLRKTTLRKHWES